MSLLCSLNIITYQQLIIIKMRSSLKLTSSTKMGKDQAKKVKIIINCLYESNDSFDFREPVDWKGMGLTDYLSVVKYPMDLSTVLKRIKEEKYENVEDVLDDLQLIWDNCRAYNPDNSWIHSVAQKLERSFKKMVKNYYPDLNIVIPIKQIEQQKQSQGPANLFEDDNEDITYHQKLKFSEQIGYLSSDQLSKVIDQFVNKCPKAYKDTGNGYGQILVDNVDLIFFNQVSIMVRNMLSNGEGMQIEDDKPKSRGRGRPPINLK